MKKGPTEKSDRFFKFIIEKRELATKPFMPHFDINYIISKHGRELNNFLPCFVIVFRLVRDVVANHKTTRYAGAATKVIQKNHLA